MAGGRRRAALAAIALVLVSRAAAGQDSTLSRALDLEWQGKCHDAVPLYRQAILGGAGSGALLGLERCYSDLGTTDSILGLVDTLLRHTPKDPTAHTVQLRSLNTLHRYDAARNAFERWVAAAPRDAAPFRVYARLLLDAGRARTADTVLRLAEATLGTGREIAPEVAELRGALGMWEASARSWREALVLSPFLEQSAIYVLSQAPDTARDSVRTVLTEPPIELHARRVLAGLELRWRSARIAWNALAPLAPDDSTIQAWLDFAREVEAQNEWGAARDALVAVLRQHEDPQVRVRAVTAALEANDPSSALALLQPLAATRDSALASRVVVLKVRALSATGHPEQAEALMGDRGAGLGVVARAEAARTIAWGWVQRGDVARARAALAAEGEEADERTAAWMSLYTGDLRTARTALRHLQEATPDAVLALSVLSRTTADSSPAIGEAFLALARHDTADATARFERTAADMPEAAPALLGIAGRLAVAAPDTARSLTIWARLVSQYPDAPEAAEAELEWAKTLRQRGDSAGAIAHLEHMILTYPRSALVPQARRELQIVRGVIPPEP